MRTTVLILMACLVTTLTIPLVAADPTDPLAQTAAGAIARASSCVDVDTSSVPPHVTLDPMAC